jgi:phosphoribosylglycinamide formyltransferase-1
MTGDLGVAVLASGAGTTLDELAVGLRRRGVPATIVLVLCDRPTAGAIDVARRHGFPVEVVPTADPVDWSRRASAALRRSAAGLVVLAGYLPILPAEFLAAWSGRIVNVHPSLLPLYGGRGMYGRHVHEAVLRDHRPESGVTVHLVTSEVDAGPILWQKSVPVSPDETPESLRAKVRPLEIEGLIAVIDRFARGGPSAA